MQQIPHTQFLCEFYPRSSTDDRVFRALSIVEEGFSFSCSHLFSVSLRLLHPRLAKIMAHSGSLSRFHFIFEIISCVWIEITMLGGRTMEPYVRNLPGTKSLKILGQRIGGNGERMNICPKKLGGLNRSAGNRGQSFRHFRARAILSRGLRVSRRM